MSLPVASRISIILLPLVCLVISGCMTTHPGYRERTDLDNGVRSYEDPEFDRSLSPWSYGTIGLGAAAGAAGGYLYGYNNPPLDSAGIPKADATTSGLIYGGIGALLGGGGVSYLILKLTDSEPKPVTRETAENWVEMIDDDLKLLDYSKSAGSAGVSTITTIPKSADSSFFIDDIEDARLFAKAFPLSPYADRVVADGSDRVKSGEVQELIELFPSVPSISRARERLVNDCPNLGACMEAATRYPDQAELSITRARSGLRGVTRIEVLAETARRYPDLAASADARAAEISDSTHLYVDYFSYFPNGSRAGDYRQKLLRIINTDDSIATIAMMASAYPQFQRVADARAATIAETTGRHAEYLEHFPDGSSASAFRQKGERVRKQLTDDVRVWLRGIARDLEKEDMSYDGETFFYADWDGDGDEDVAVQYMGSGAGSGTGFMSYAFFRNRGGNASLDAHVDYIEGDYGNSRGGQSIMSIVGNTVRMEAWDYYAFDETYGDGMCCPTLRTVLDYEYSGGRLNFKKIAEPQRRIMDGAETSTRSLQTFGVEVVEGTSSNSTGNNDASADRGTSNDGEVQAGAFDLGCSGGCCDKDYCANVLSVEIINHSTRKTKEVTVRVVIRDGSESEIYNETHVVKLSVPPNTSLPSPDIKLKRNVVNSAMVPEISVVDASF